MQFEFYIFILNERIGCVMVSVLACSVVDCGFEPRSGQTKEYKICMCCLSAKHDALRRKSKEWLDRNHNTVPDLSDMSIHGRVFQWTSSIKIQGCWSSSMWTSSSSNLFSPFWSTILFVPLTLFVLLQQCIFSSITFDLKCLCQVKTMDSHAYVW
jgi:hypothetical protein